MKKSLIRQKIKEKLEKLDNDISYSIDGHEFEIKVNKVIKKGDGSLNDYSSEDYKEYTIIIDGQKKLYKTYGYAGGGWRYWDDEEFHFGVKEIYNYMESTDEKGYLYINGNYSFQDNNIWFTKTPSLVYKVSEDFMISPHGVYYIPEKNEIGFTIKKDTRKVIDSPEEAAFDKIKKIYDDYNYNGKKICDSILKELKNNVSNDKVLPVEESKYKSLEKSLKNMLYIPVSDEHIKTIVEEINEIKSMKSLYDNLTASNKILEKEIDEFNNMLEKCLDIAIADIKSYEKELETAKLKLKKKYNKKTTV